MGAPYERYPQEGKPFGGFRPTLPSAMQRRIGYGFGVAMWLWIFHRARNDMPHMYAPAHLSRSLFLSPTFSITAPPDPV